VFKCQPEVIAANYNIPNNREWAILIWFGVFLAWALWKGKAGPNFVQLLRAALHAKLLMSFGLLLGYVALEDWLGSRLHLWRTELIKDTVIWLLVAIALLFRSAETTRQPYFFRKRVAATLGITEFLAFFTNLFVLSLFVEFFLQPLLFLIAGVGVVAEMQARTRSVKRFADVLLALIGLSLFVFTVQQLVANWSDIDKGILLQQIALPVWLTLGLLPFIYLFGLLANYELAFMRINFATDDRRARRRAKLALVSKLHLRARDTGTFSDPWFSRITSAPSFAAARQVVGGFQQSQREKKRAAAEDQERLRRYAGSQETDAEGRRLDRREFKETIRALRWLAACEQGWYDNKDLGRKQYRTDLLEALGDDFFDGHGLPADPGIKVKIAKRGQSWYAWRRTVTGWCFAVGAAGPPPDQWEYDGPEPPNGFPGKVPGWVKSPFSEEGNRNWTEFGRDASELDRHGPDR
jgi:hypothetical protein